MSAKGLLAVILALLTVATLAPQVAAQEENPIPRFYQSYNQVLKEFVDEDGMVDYRGLKNDAGDLEAFLEKLGGVEKDKFAELGVKVRVAYWLNAYNAITLKAIIDHHPLPRQADGLSALRFPDNSIRQIDGVWKDLKWNVVGGKKTLHEIEHEVLRERYNAPRIHLALVCAAMSCPELRQEPYVGPRLIAQLNDQGREFFSQPDKFRIDRAESTVYISPIFDWFKEDFVKSYKPETGFEGHGDEERAVLNFITRYLDENDARYLRHGEFDIEWLDYDWSLNEQ
jgi:hypothetical protein